MNHTHDRRAPGTARIPFDAMVEVGGALGPSFEAQAVNLSEQGMSLRTAYLPEVGQPVMCRFDAGEGMTVVAAGEVLWNAPLNDGGEFGIRFTNLDGASTVALQRVLGMVEDGSAPAESGRKVRLHIEGLASPMRARIKEQIASGVTAYSELGFLQMGKPLELEDAVSGTRRPASIDRVQVEIDDASRIPQLVVSLRYDDMSSLAGVAVPADGGAEDADDDMPPSASQTGPEHEVHASAHDAEPAMAHEQTDASMDDASIQEESNKLKSTFARNAAKVTPAIMSWAKRAKVAAALVAAKARRGSEAGEDVEIPVRRTTAPAPGGGLHASGRKVVRGSLPEVVLEEPAPAKAGRLKMTKKKAVVIGSIGIAGVLVAIAMRKPAPAPQLASAPPAETAEVAAAPATIAPATPASAPLAAAPAPVAPPMDPLASAAMAAPVKPGKPTPFTNGPVGAHPTVLKIKMDGPVEGIQGATQPTGFTIVTPNRKAVDPSTSLASKDARLEGVRIANESGGAELNVSFKDTVPNYVVRAHGDTLELVLAKASGPDKAEARVTPAKKSKKGKRR